MISMIAAHDKNRLIGKDNWMPWNIPNDLGYFKAMTLNKTIVMGRKTFESFGQPLPNRKHLILTTRDDYEVEGCQIFHDIDSVLDEIRSLDEEVFIIGGGEIYERFLPFADRLYITYIDEEFEGDTYFPEYDLSKYEITLKEKGLKNDENPHDYYFIQYDRV
ncbi:dihydrofolate reductase [Pelagirhabdus alkalitolerans]|uniref:Dihydrofolate reductase n=1 Tax=Pelagirhabdus alkalitolerans TaxID=1612202 RepID=A0A1G6H9L4_9BACI|nr:dihydrofolate reductase [Pelagirhabdus alkalitolerans]SDB90833.1 dihydrofolate reductase [Pelagirhabdus alkalitolerans]